MIYICIKETATGLSPREKAERDSAISRELLFSVLSDELSLTPLEIRKTDKGKPYFEDKKYPPFSISHTDGAVCVAIAEGWGSVGVDIEKCGGRLSDKRLTDRFFPGLAFSDNEISDIRISGGCVGENSVGCLPETLFTLGEAIIKCDGGGFAISASAALLSKKMKKSSFILTVSGECYAVSVAVKEKEN